MVDDDLTLLARLADAALAAGHRALADAEAVQQAGNDVARAFRSAAREAVLALLRQQEHAVLLLAEDAPPKRFGRGAPVARIIVRPVEGAENFARGLPLAVFSHFCIASVPPAGPLDVATVRAALVRPLSSCAPVFVLQRGAAHMEWEGQRQDLQASGVTALSDAMLSVALDGHATGRALAEMLAQGRGVRAVGSCSAALLAIARGQLDAHIDIRATLSAESWLAAAALVRAAGGVVMLLDEALERAGAPINLQQRRGLVAAASRDLLEDILAGLRRAFLP